jgi:hypothetical protein
MVKIAPHSTKPASYPPGKDGKTQDDLGGKVDYSLYVNKNDWTVGNKIDKGDGSVSWLSAIDSGTQNGTMGNTFVIVTRYKDGSTGKSFYDSGTGHLKGTENWNYDNERTSWTA